MKLTIAFWQAGGTSVADQIADIKAYLTIDVPELLKEVIVERTTKRKAVRT